MKSIKFPISFPNHVEKMEIILVLSLTPPHSSYTLFDLKMIFFIHSSIHILYYTATQPKKDIIQFILEVIIDYIFYYNQLAMQTFIV